MSEDVREKGGISVETEHIFPIIKKWLYSEKEIFLREIVSNACDAITKLKRLSSLGHVRDIENNYKITVKIDKEAGTLTVSDNGIGMNEDEVRRYICQIALSGALDFIKKYEGEDTSANGIIGHFGLGFYSSFMVSDSVDIITRSYDGSPAVKWVCTENGEYELYDSERQERGTDVVMHISEDEKEYLEEGKIRSILHKYCSFMPIEIYLTVEGKEEEKKHDHECTCEHKDDEDHECTCGHSPKPINDTSPLWQKIPSECKDEEYKEFYNKVFTDFREPLFHIHINADYPLNFKGILYFPRINSEYESLEGQVKLYYNQVFVADNIKEVIPEYMLMLKGVLDCPELPLNVSRSYLQNNSYIAKISAHIVKKVCDKLNSMFNTEREAYEKLWDDIKLFVEYASLRDRKFYDRIKGSVLFPVIGGGHKTMSEYLEAAKAKNEQSGNIIYYATDKIAQAQYISMLNSQGIEVVLLDKLIDTQFIQNVENADDSGDKDKKVKFMRVDSDVLSALKGDGDLYESAPLAELFKKVSGEEKLEVKFEVLKDKRVPAILTVSEQSRRMEDMMKMYRMSSGEDKDTFKMPLDSTLILNSGNSLIRKLGDKTEEEGTEAAVRQIYKLALLSQRKLTADELQSFLYDSFDILEKTVG
jgi:molecular chaperone HtpG